MAQHPATDQTPTGQAPAQMRLLLGSVLLFYLGQQALNPVIAPLARQMHLAEWQVGVAISTAALMVVLTSQYWGRRAQSLGHKKVLVAAMSAGALCMAGVWLVADLGTRGLLRGTALFAALVLLRGVGFGTAMSMVPPTVQACVAGATEDEESRIRGMASIGTIQGMSMVLGAAAGGLLSGLGLLVPLAIIPALMAAAAALLGLRLHPGAQQAAGPVPSLRPTDPRVRLFLLAGFGVYVAMGMVHTCIGFLVQDRLYLGAEHAALITGVALVTSGIGMILAQGMLVPRLPWSPRMLVAVGSTGTTLGCALVGMGHRQAVMIGGMLIIGLGLGLAMPGYTAGASLAVDADEQGALGGLVGATNGLTFIIAPTLATSLYITWHAAPVVLSGALTAIVAVATLWQSCSESPPGWWKL